MSHMYQNSWFAKPSVEVQSKGVCQKHPEGGTVHQNGGSGDDNSFFLIQIFQKLPKI